MVSVEKQKTTLKESNTPTPPHEITPLSGADWLAYGLGGFLIIGNFYRLPSLIQFVSQYTSRPTQCAGIITGPFSTSCIPVAPTFTALAGATLPVVLLLLGALLVAYKKRFLAQSVALLLLAQLALLYAPYLSEATAGAVATPYFWFLLLQPVFQVPIAELVAAIVCSRYLAEPSLSSHVQMPSFVFSIGPKTKSWVKFFVVGVVVLMVAWGAATFVNYSKNAAQDKQTADAIGPVANRIYAGISTTNATSWQEAASWRAATEKAAKLSKLNYVAGIGHFQLCATFLTDQSHGVGLKGAMSPADIAHHPSGYVCFMYDVSAAQTQKKDSRISGDMLIVGIRYLPDSQHMTIQTYSVVSTEAGDMSNDVDLSSVPVFHNDGSSALPSEVKLGSMVAIHYQVDLIRAVETVYKVVILDPAVNPNYCNLILLGGLYYPAPSPLCPGTVNNLTLDGINATSLTARTTRNGGISLEWSLTAVPSAYDPNGAKIALTDLHIGARVNLIYSGSQIAEIREIAD